MGSNVCMNGLCGATTSSPEWKRGWALKSGGFANLCYNCGIAYDNVLYCEKFHLNEAGWRECKFCEKPIHCGCIVSKYLHDYLDFGGIACITCLRTMASRSLRPLQSSTDHIRNGFGPLTPINNWQPTAIESQINGVSGDKGKLQLIEYVEKHQPFPSTPSNNVDPNLSIIQVKRESKVLPAGEVGTGFSSSEARNAFQLAAQKSIPSSMFSKPSNSRPTLGLKDVHESLAQASLTFSLSGPQGTSNSGMSSPGGVRAVESNEPDKVSAFKQGQRTRHIQPKPPKPGSGSGSSAQPPQANKGTPQQTRVARPPAEGRGRNQLLPRYWPRITDQELEQISGDLNSNIVPLFEKILSASDAGRIGRLVLPKACAEAYFPPISNSEGLPIRIQDIKGKEWTFQFRFWPNNNSRMYVLEGVTPCIQTMQLEAGDTVTFSRMDPGNKLVIGCRKATNSIDTQEAEIKYLLNGPSGETSHTGVNDVTPMKKDYEGTNGHSVHRPSRVSEKKRSRNIGSKSKRMLMHSEEAMELRVTWKEAQELLRPPPNAQPNVVMIDNFEFEEYDEPPVFGKRTVFTTQASGSLSDRECWKLSSLSPVAYTPSVPERLSPKDSLISKKSSSYSAFFRREQEQWGQCDNCFKWRRLPLDILLPSRWTCSDNTWDPNRCSCSAPDELNARELERIFGVSKDFKRRRMTEKRIAEEEQEEPTGLDALALVAVLGDLDEPSLGATTTRHPRHRVGCTCIVCIQPPSGQGHKSTCICNVCLTVKRRFKTLMLRKKKRQMEREAELARGEAEGGGNLNLPVPLNEVGPTGSRENNGKEHGTEIGETSKGQLDLNCDPIREEELMMLAEAERMSVTSLVSLPLEGYNGHNNGVDAHMVPCLLSRVASETDEYPPDDRCFSSPMDTADDGNKGDGE